MKKPRLREGCVASVSIGFDEARPSCVGLICDPMDHIAFQAPLSLGILQARLLEWVTVPFSRGSSRPRDGTQVSCIAGRFFTVWATREAPLGNSGWNKPAVYSWKPPVLFGCVTEIIRDQAPPCASSERVFSALGLLHSGYNPGRCLRLSSSGYRGGNLGTDERSN